MATYTTAQIIALGGKTWTPSNDSAARIYLNNWAALAGLEIDTYNTGSISYAELDGRKISNSKARQYLAGSKVYLNTADGKIYFQGGAKDLMDEVVDGINTALLALEEAAHAEDAERTATRTPAASTVQTILTALRAAGRTVAQIAAALGVHRSSIYRWANGTRHPRPTRTAQLTALAA